MKPTPLSMFLCHFRRGILATLSRDITSLKVFHDSGKDAAFQIVHGQVIQEFAKLKELVTIMTKLLDDPQLITEAERLLAAQKWSAEQWVAMSKLIRSQETE